MWKLIRKSEGVVVCGWVYIWEDRGLIIMGFASNI